MKTILPMAALVTGVVLIAGSLLWPIVFAPSRMTEERSARMDELNSERNLLKFALIEAKNNPSMHSGRNPAEVQAEFDKVDAEYQELFDEFQGRRDGPQETAKILRLTGIALAVVGAGAALATRKE